MANYRLTHDLDDDPTVQDAHVLDEPLEFSDGEAVVEDRETARSLAQRHVHLQFAGRVTDDSDAGDTDTSDADEADEGGEETPDAVADAPFDPGDYSVGSLRDELDDRDLSDDDLAALADAERAGDDRTTALDAIEDHRSDTEE